MSSHVIHPIFELSQVGEARRTAVRVAEAAGFAETEKGQVAIVATELATNLVRHAKNGRILIRSSRSQQESVVEILTVDDGPGRADFGACVVDGYSTAGTPGNGLGAVKRMSKTFDYFSMPDRGTIVLAHVVDRRGGAIAKSNQKFEWGAISVAAPLETVCGDAWQIEEHEGKLRIMVVDGLGHGPYAAEAAEKACREFQAHSAATPKILLERSHVKMVGTRGAALAAAFAAGDSEELQYAGIGNIAGSLHGPTGSRGLMSYNGIVGSQMRSAQQLQYVWPQQWILVMHSDGIKTRWDFSQFPGLITRHPAVICALLLRDFCRGKDDATIVVVRRKST